MESVLVKLQAFTVNGSGGLCDGECFYCYMVAVCFYYNVFTINGKDGVCDRECYLHVVTGSVFSKAWGLYYNLLFW